MRRYFSVLLLCLWTALWGRDILLITYAQEENEKKALFLSQVLLQDLHIPRQLITIRQEEIPCRISEEAILHLCLSEEGEMKTALIQTKMVNEGLTVFQEGFKR